jgi:hypothetical protein
MGRLIDPTHTGRTAPAHCMVCEVPMDEQPVTRRGDLIETPICGPECRRVWDGRVASRIDEILGGAA